MEKMIIQGKVKEVFMLKGTGRMLDIFGVRIALRLIGI